MTSSPGVRVSPAASGSVSRSPPLTSTRSQPCSRQPRGGGLRLFEEAKGLVTVSRLALLALWASRAPARTRPDRSRALVRRLDHVWLEALEHVQLAQPPFQQPSLVGGDEHHAGRAPLVEQLEQRMDERARVEHDAIGQRHLAREPDEFAIAQRGEERPTAPRLFRVREALDLRSEAFDPVAHRSCPLRRSLGRDVAPELCQAVLDIDRGSLQTGIGSGVRLHVDRQHAVCGRPPRQGQKGIWIEELCSRQLDHPLSTVCPRTGEDKPGSASVGAGPSDRVAGSAGGDWPAAR